MDQWSTPYMSIINEMVEVVQIETSDCPNGYVHLRLFGKLQFNWEIEQFEYRASNDTGSSLQFSPSCETDMIHGPATYISTDSFLHVDIVRSVRLLAWPPVAQSWISRDRHYAWPSNAVVSEVQRNGCDLVPVSHRDHKHDSLQWRYSFSRAEVILIRSWTPIQQLVYHMLRYFAKRTIFCEWKDGDKVVCNYHIKTLMLWACERKSPVWWGSNCVLVLCSKLLDIFMKWIRKKICPHYFIPEWNSLDYNIKESRRLDILETLRIHINIQTLSEWFRINYLSKVFDIEICSISLKHSEYQYALDTIAASYMLSKEFETVLQNWVVEKHGLWQIFIYEESVMLHGHGFQWNDDIFCRFIHSRNLTPELQFVNMAVATLHLDCYFFGMRESELSSHEMLDVLSEVVLKLSGHDTWNFNKPYKIPFKECSKWYFIKGVRLLSNTLQETFCCILSLGENMQTIFQISTQHSRRIQ